MKNLYNKHKTTSKVEASPYIHNCLHEDGTKLISRAELLIYECIKKCGLQAIYEYLLVNEKTKTSMRPDFYGYRYAKPFIIEFKPPKKQSQITRITMTIRKKRERKLRPKNQSSSPNLLRRWYSYSTALPSSDAPSAFSVKLALNEL